MARRRTARRSARLVRTSSWPCRRRVDSRRARRMGRPTQRASEAAETHPSDGAAHRLTCVVRRAVQSRTKRSPEWVEARQNLEAMAAAVSSMEGGGSPASSAGGAPASSAGGPPGGSIREPHDVASASKHASDPEASTAPSRAPRADPVRAMKARVFRASSTNGRMLLTWLVVRSRCGEAWGVGNVHGYTGRCRRTRRSTCTGRRAGSALRTSGWRGRSRAAPRSSPGCGMALLRERAERTRPAWARAPSRGSQPIHPGLRSSGHSHTAGSASTRRRAGLAVCRAWARSSSTAARPSWWVDT